MAANGVERQRLVLLPPQDQIDRVVAEIDRKALAGLYRDLDGDLDLIKPHQLKEAIIKMLDGVHVIRPPQKAP